MGPVVSEENTFEEVSLYKYEVNDAGGGSIFWPKGYNFNKLDGGL